MEKKKGTREKDECRRRLVDGRREEPNKPKSNCEAKNNRKIKKILNNKRRGSKVDGRRRGNGKRTKGGEPAEANRERRQCEKELKTVDKYDKQHIKTREKKS